MPERVHIPKKSGWREIEFGNENKGEGRGRAKRQLVKKERDNGILEFLSKLNKIFEERWA